MLLFKTTAIDHSAIPPRSKFGLNLNGLNEKDADLKTDIFQQLECS
jgi:hypothetical protein